MKTTKTSARYEPPLCYYHLSVIIIKSCICTTLYLLYFLITMMFNYFNGYYLFELFIFTNILAL